MDANPRAAAAQDLSAQALEALASEIEATVEAVDYEIAAAAWEEAVVATSYYVIGHGPSSVPAIREADSDAAGFPGELVQRLTDLAQEHDDCWAVTVCCDEAELDRDPAVVAYLRVASDPGR